MIFLSINHYSVDDQVVDVVNYLTDADPDLLDRFVAEFPEFPELHWSGSWVDAEASGVDPEYMSWVADWIEANSPVFWFEGEPVILEAGESLDD